MILTRTGQEVKISKPSFPRAKYSFVTTLYSYKTTSSSLKVVEPKVRSNKNNKERLNLRDQD